MRKIIVLSMMTLDGVIQGPGSPGEDTSGGFEYSGWVAPYTDEVYDAILQKELEPAEYLLGRKTFKIWAAYWPAHGDIWPGINEGTKYVFSNTLKKSSPIVAGWKNTVVINKSDDIRKIKASEGPDIQVWGSGELVRLLLQHDFVDELRLKIHPLTLGKGKKFFGKGILPAAFTVTGNTVTPKGVYIASYKRGGQVETGTVGA